MNSWDRIKVVEKVTAAADELGASNLQQQRQLIFGCGNASEREVYFGLMSFFYDSSLQENQYERQKLAATILLSVANRGAGVFLAGARSDGHMAVSNRSAKPLRSASDPKWTTRLKDR